MTRTVASTATHSTERSTPPVHRSYSQINQLRTVLDNTVESEQGCLEWQGPINSGGYGLTRRAPGAKVVSAHRLAYEYAHGVALTPDQFVCHSCDNRRCVNPDHLWLGDHKANMSDMAAKGRHGAAKLTLSDVREIRARHFSVGRGRHVKSNTDELACEFGVTRETIQLVASRRTWKAA